MLLFLWTISCSKPGNEASEGPSLKAAILPSEHARTLRYDSRYEGNWMTQPTKTYDIAILTLVILVLLFTPFAFGGVNQTKALLGKTFLSPVLFYSNYFSRLGIAAAVLLWLLKMILAKDVRFAKTPLDLPIVLFFGYTFLWFVFSPAKCLTGAELANILTYVAVYYLVINNVRTKAQMHIVVAALILSGLLVASMGLIQSSGYLLSASRMKFDYAINLVRPKQYWGRIGGTFVCPNHFAGYMEMIVPFALAYILFSRIPLGRKILVAFCGLVMTIGLLLSISRGGWAAFAVSVLFLFAVAAREKKVPMVARILPLLVVVLSVGIVFTRSTHVQKRFAQSFSEKEDSSYLKRAHIWIDTMSLVRDNLLVGTGPGTFDLAFREYRRPSFLLAAGYTHNDYLHALADYGIIGFAALLYGIIVFLRKMWTTSRKLKRSTDKALCYGVLGAVVALLVHSIVDFNMHIPSNAMTIAAIVGIGMCIRQYRLHLNDEWVAMSEQRPGFFTPALQYGLIAAVSLAVLGVLYLNFRAYASTLVLHRASEKDPSREFADQEVAEKDFDAAKRLYRTSASLFPSNPKSWASLAEMHVWRADRELANGQKNRFYFLLIGGREAIKDYEAAADAVRKAMKLNKLDASLHLTLARAYAGIVYVNREHKRGSPTQYRSSREKYAGLAEAEFQKALEMDPNNHQHHGHLGTFYYGTGRYDLAEREIQQSLEILRDDTTYAKEKKDLQELLKKIRQKRGETAGAKATF